MARVGDGVNFRIIPKPITTSLFSTRLRISASASSGVFITLLNFQRHLIRPPCFGPRSNRADNRGSRHRAGSSNHPAGKRRGVELMLSAYSTSEICIAFSSFGLAFTMQRYGKWPPMESSSVSGFQNTFAVVVVIPVKKDRAEQRPTAYRQYRAPETVCASFPAVQPSAETPVHITSGRVCEAAGNASRAVRTLAG